ncbi:hypothetical protein BsWGS_03141 [Bradybaena similaris]
MASENAVFNRSAQERSAQEPGHFSWLEPNLLAACKFPDSLENLQFLVNHNVSCLVTLTAERQVDRSDIQEDRLKIVWIPIRDYTPPSIEQVKEFIHHVLETKATGKAVCVHCAHGLGRTGTMLACYFVQVHNMQPDDAIAHVRKLRPGSVETTEQELLVTEFYNDMKKKEIHPLSH